MANKKIVDFTELAETPASGDMFEVVDVSDTTDAATGTSKRVSRSNLIGGLAATGHTHALAAGATDVTASPAELNILDGATLSTAELNHVDGVTSAIQTQLDAKAADSAVVHDTGDETIAGVKTFSSDPLIPDEAYNATDWNGSLEPPTKNAVRDKIESMSGGGQSTYDAIVAPSGGDYTTLGAAITAASAGWSICIKEGTYTESAITSSLANLTIVGENPETAILSHGTANLVFSGAGLNIRNIGFVSTTGCFHATGAEATIDNIRVDQSDYGATTAGIYIQGIASSLTNSNLKCTSTTGTPSLPFLRVNGIGSRIVNNYFSAPARGTSSGAGIIRLVNSFQTKIVDNTFESTSNVTDGYGVNVASADYVTVSNNTFKGFSVTSLAIALELGSNHAIASGNTFNGGRVKVNNYNTFTGNHVLNSFASSTAVTIGLESVVTGNTITGATGSVASSSVGIGTNAFADDAVISANRISYFATGVNITTSTEERSIISGNIFTGNTTAIADSGTATTIQSNSGVDELFRKESVRMKNTSGATITAGEVVIFKSVAAGDEVTTTTSAGDTKVYGVATAAITNNAYGYIQIAGKTTILKVNGTTDIAVGDFLSCFTTAGIAQKASAGQMAIAIALEAYTTDDSSGVIDALIISPRII